MLRSLAAATLFALTAGSAQGFVLQIDNTQFTMTPQINQLRDFAFRLDIDAPLVAGQSYFNPVINDLTYSVYGILGTQPTPSGFGAFDLQRSGIDNAEFYAQGSSFSMAIAASADLNDGLQLSELSSFALNAREVGTGRYHPPIFELAGGIWAIQNSNNNGGVNPGNNQVVAVDFGEEYVVNLVPIQTSTIVAPVPLPAGIWLLAGGLALLGGWRRMRASA